MTRLKEYEAILRRILKERQLSEYILKRIERALSHEANNR